jgi:iron complex outermembrane receptor protein
MKHLFFNFGENSPRVFLSHLFSLAQAALGMAAAALCRQRLFFMVVMERPAEALMTANKKRLGPASYSEQPARTPLFLFFLLTPFFFFGQTIEKDTTSLQEIVLSAVKTSTKEPITFSTLKKEDFERRNLGQDIPIMMNYLPSVVTTSDAGAGVGYTGIRVRGSDATRVNVTLNGVPYNDSESQGTFWVNLVDLASSTKNIQLQRGVGSSTNGAGAFGASLHLSTDDYSMDPFVEGSSSYGSFNTNKNTVKFSSGLLNKKFEFSGRLSNITSDGYIDRAFVDMKGYALQGHFLDGGTQIRALAFGGRQQTYQAWYGLEDADKLVNDRTFNVAGMYTDANGQMQFYDNEVDNYDQDHYHLYWDQKWSDKLRTNVTFHYTKGKGYFEQYREDDRFSTYGLAPIVIGGTTINSTDLIRRRWLDNDFYGLVYSLNYQTKKSNFVLGGGVNRYEGAHFGEIIWAKFASDSHIRDRYYDDFGRKDDINIFVKETYALSEKFSLFADLQYRYVHYKTDSHRVGLVNDVFHFFNPKAGLVYQMSDKNQWYASYAKGSREPNRNDYEEGAPKPEFLHDFEMGWRHQSKKLKLNVNGFYMRYKNQLVLSGGLTDTGAPVRENVGDSYRLGLEIDANLMFNKWLSWQPNLTLSTNQNLDYNFARDGVLQRMNQSTIAFSPSVVAASNIQITPFKDFTVNFLSKFVSQQFMTNFELTTAVLPSYFVNDLNVSYTYHPKNLFFKTVVFNLLVNNIFDHVYESNGFHYSYDDDWSNPPAVQTIDGIGFFPQAGINLIFGLSLRF